MHASRSLLTASSLLALLLSACGGGNTGISLDGSGAVLQGWERYEDAVAGYSFSYPTRLQLIDDGQTATVRHEVAHDHPDPCDFSGGAERVGTILDFHVTFEMVEKALRGAVIEKEGSDYVATEYMRGDSFVLGGDSPVEQAVFGRLRGHRITSGVEGCGRHTYYFSSPTGRTLVVQRRFVPEFSAVNPDADELKELQGVIDPEQEDMLFNRLMSTLEFRD